MRIFALGLFCLSGMVLWGQTYRVGPGDLLKISVLELKEIENEYRIDNGGFLTLPYLGRIPVRGLTVTEIYELVTEKLKQEAVNNPQVFIDLVEYNYRPISVIGAVKEPGKLNRLHGNISLIEAITQVGGITSNASDTIVIMRKTPEGLGETLKVSYTALMVEGHAYLNIPIFPGDTINIPVEQPMVVSIIGEVNKPGSYEFKRSSRITILRVVATAGGFTDYAKRSKLVVRRNNDGEPEEHKVDVRGIQENRLPDFVMQHDDVVIVP